MLQPEARRRCPGSFLSSALACRELCSCASRAPCEWPPLVGQARPVHCLCPLVNGVALAAGQGEFRIDAGLQPPGELDAGAWSHV